MAKQILTEADGLGPDSGRSTQGSTSSRFLNSLVARMPYSYSVINQGKEKNPRFDTFNEITSRKEERLNKLSIFQQQDDAFGGSSIIDKSYHQFMYADVDFDKIRRLQEYRRMAAYAELSDAIDEICDECISPNKQGDIVEFNLKGNYDNNIRSMIKEEWDNFLTIFNLEEKGWGYFRKLLVDGEVFFENLIHPNKEFAGILGVIPVPSELINPIYDNVQNMLINGYLLRKPKVNTQKSSMAKDAEELITLEKNQITYIHSGIWNEDNTIRLPYIENSRRAYKQLSLIEDSIVVYRLVRAPEKLVFYVDVGNSSPTKAESILKRTMQAYWTRRSFTNGKVSNIYDPQSMLDSYWFARRTGNDGTKVEPLQGGQNLGQLDDLMYFMKKLYKSLKVPQSRLDPADPFKDGAEITREELRFARFVMRIQRQFATSIKSTFITHLKLRKLWDKLKIREHEIFVEFAPPTNFQVVRDQQIFELMYQNYSQIAQDELLSNSYGQRYFLKMTDGQLAENREWLKKDAALKWELDQISMNGPEWRKQIADMDTVMDDFESGGGMGGGAGASALPGGGPDLEGGSGGGADTDAKSELPPEFGPGPQETSTETPA
jgi:hypothetical protein